MRNGSGRLAAFVAVVWLLARPAAAADRAWVLQAASGSLSVSPASLAMTFSPRGQGRMALSLGLTNLGPVANFAATSNQARWRLPERDVEVALELSDQGLLVHITSDRPGEFAFPVVPETAATKGWILPLFEGVYVPAGDRHWSSFLTNHGDMNTTADFTLPFIALDYGGATLTCIISNPFNNRVGFARSDDGHLKARLTHEFTRNHPIKEYAVLFRIGNGSPIAPALAYRDWLVSRGEFVSLRDKIRKTPAAGKLLGAAHAYLWGNGLSPEMIRRLAEAGLDRLWLGSASWDGFVNRPETVAAAKEAGYLIGPYDSYHSIHHPKEAGTWETAQFDLKLYETGPIVNPDGTRRHGFKGKGYLLSPEAARPYVEKRVSGLMEAFHANSWFIDCDGFGEFFDDYSPAHSATQQSDMQARIARMAWIRDTFGAVIGTEGCSAGVAPAVHFAHGVLTPVIGWGDPDLKDKHSPYYLGRYFPPNEPQVFFKPIPIKEEYRYLYFEPRFRLPLFQAAFHDSVIATHHWSFGSFKTRDQARTVELLELLYNVPPLYHLNLQEFDRRKTAIKRHYDFFSRLHRQLALLPLTHFQWLTRDHLVQRATFGDEVDLVANFSAADFHFENAAVGSKTVLAKWRKTGRTEAY